MSKVTECSLKAWDKHTVEHFILYVLTRTYTVDRFSFVTLGIYQVSSASLYFNFVYVPYIMSLSHRPSWVNYFFIHLANVFRLESFLFTVCYRK